MKQNIDSQDKQIVIQLCREDQHQLAAHLIDPPETPEKFKKLVQWRKQIMKNSSV